YTTLFRSQPAMTQRVTLEPKAAGRGGQPAPGLRINPTVEEALPEQVGLTRKEPQVRRRHGQTEETRKGEEQEHHQGHRQAPPQPTERHGDPPRGRPPSLRRCGNTR